MGFKQQKLVFDQQQLGLKQQEWGFRKKTQFWNILFIFS